MTPTLSLLLMTLTNINLLFSSSPLLIGFNIMMMAMAMTSLTSFTSSWLAMMIFVIYIGGLLVLFAYFLAIQPNLVFSNAISFMKSLIVVSSMFIFYMNIFPSCLMFKLNQIEFILFSKNLSIILLLASVLFLILIVVATMSMKSKAPLRSFK